MKIAYDASGLTPPLTGVGTYINQLLEHLLAADGHDTYWLLAHRRAYLETWSNGNSSPQARPIGLYFPNRLFWMQVLLPVALRRLRPDVAHFTNFVAPLAADVPTVVTVHDLSLLRQPYYGTRRQRLLMRPLIEPTARRATAIITVSEQSKAEIVQTLGVEAARVRVVYEAADPCFGMPADPNAEQKRRAQYGWDASARNILFVGSFNPRKNLPRLITALARLNDRGAHAPAGRAHLWLVGPVGAAGEGIAQRARAAALDLYMHITGYLPRADLAAFYRGCDAFVMPSLHEGFGLPVIEAMSAGAPVVVSDIPVFRELAGDAACFVDPLDSHSISHGLERVLTDDALNRELRRRGRERAAHFSWERAARETAQVYAEVAA